MPILSSDMTSVLSISTDSETWIIKPGVAVLNPGHIAVWSTADDTVVINHGTIAGGSGVDFRKDNPTLHNAWDGTIVSEVSDAVFFYGTGRATLTNEGSIFSPTKAVRIELTAGNDADSVAIGNGGSIRSGDTGILLRSNATKTSSIDNSGSIVAERVALDLRPADQATVRVFNTGLIQSGAKAIDLSGTGILKLVNLGSILGDVVASAGVIRNGGSIEGDVRLGHGGDVYKGKGGAVEGLIDGGRGDDKLSGGSSGDALYGNFGSDTLKGGIGADRFVYRSVDESEPGASSRDRIVDFHRSAGDVIDLSAINGTFTFIGTDAFSGAAAEIRYKAADHGIIVEADKTGDGKADFAIELIRTGTIGADDFVL